MFNPFSENIIFVDTEFSSMNPYEGELISIGLVKLNGEELYLELEHVGEVSKWVKENVAQFLTDKKVSRQKAIKQLKDFIREEKPFMVGYINNFDSIYLYKLFGVENYPFHWTPIDFASVLFAFGIDPESYYYKDKKNFYKKLGVDHTKYRKHHALDDAKLLREVYLKFIKKR